MATHVLDTSAILALLLAEEGGDLVRDAGPDGLMSAVTLSETIAKLQDRGTPLDIALDRLDALAIAIAPFGREEAREAGAIRPATRIYNVSFADRACLALGRKTGLTILTGDRIWAHLDLGIDIRLIR